jgi:hypothetical protein
MRIPTPMTLGNMRANGVRTLAVVYDSLHLPTSRAIEEKHAR